VHTKACISVSCVRGRGLGDGRTIATLRELPTLCIPVTTEARCATQGARGSRNRKVQSTLHVTIFGRLDTSFSVLSWPQLWYPRVELCSVYVLWLQLHMWIQSGYSTMPNSAVCIGDEAVWMAKSSWKLASLPFPSIPHRYLLVLPLGIGTARLESAPYSVFPFMRPKALLGKYR